MKKHNRIELAEHLSKKYLKTNFTNLPTPIRILMYGEATALVEKAQYLMKKYGKKRLELIWEKNREVGSKSKFWNGEVG